MKRVPGRRLPVPVLPVFNVSAVPQRSPFRYPGGKSWLIPIVRQWFAARGRMNRLVEPFAGGASVGLAAVFEDFANEVILVEIDPAVAAVWTTVLSDDVEWLIQRILEFDLTPENLVQELASPPRSTPELAFQTILRNRTRYGGILAPSARLVRFGEAGRGLRSRWYPRTLAERLRAIAAYRDRLRFFHDDGFKVIQKFADDANTAFFIDPPYTAAGKRAGRRLYPYHAIDHEALFDLVASVRGDVLITYNDDDQIARHARSRGLAIARVQMKNGHHVPMTELLIGFSLNWLR